MKNSVLQLMVCAKGIRRASASVEGCGARLMSTVRLDSPNYLFLYIDTTHARPGRIGITFDEGGKKRTAGYELRRREMGGGERRGFTCADVLYLLLPDRFAQGRRGGGTVGGLRPYRIDRSKPLLRHGGDLEGIRQRLGYIAGLGATAIWLTPVQENDSPDSGDTSSYHGYAITDFYRVDPRLGSNDDYRRLVDEAHAKGLKVVMDMVFNHCGICHPWISDLPSADWLNRPGTHRGASGGKPEGNYVQTNYRLTPTVDPYAAEIDRRETVEGWFAPSMPDLNQHNPHLMAYLTQYSKWWIETAGVDGIRMDTYPYAYRDAMAAWAKEMDGEYPHMNIVGETWVAEPAFTASWQRGAATSKKDSYLKSVMDFALFERLNIAKGEETDDYLSGLNRIYNTFAYDFLYPAPENALAFVDNHDTDRFISTGGCADTLRQALAIVLVARRTPQIYYGTAIMLGGTKQGGAGDVRRDFPGGFPGDRRDAFTPNGRTHAENAMFSWLSRLLHWRRGNEAISKGSMKHFMPHGGVYAIHRAYGGRNALVVLNGLGATATFRASRYAEVIPPGTIAREVTSGQRYDLTHDITLTPRQTLVLEHWEIKN